MVNLGSIERRAIVPKGESRPGKARAHCSVIGFAQGRRRLLPFHHAPDAASRSAQGRRTLQTIMVSLLAAL